MSYIRCLSNPESLYVYASVENRKQFMILCHRIKPPMASFSKVPFDDFHRVKVPFGDFRRACIEWDKLDGYCDIKCGKLRVREILVFEETGRIVGKDRGLYETRETRFVVRVQHGRQWFNLWRTTWEYLVNRVVEREK